MTFTPITLYFLYFIFSRPQSELCTPENRIDTCKEEEYNPVCALYTGNDCNSPTGFCYRTLLRTCDACLDSDILGYTPGECEEPTFPQICTKDQEAPVSHNDETEPVCGYSKHSRLERLRGQTSIARPFASGSDACGSEQIAFHVRGECKRSNEVGICKYHKNDKECSSDDNSEPFCAYYTGEDCNEKLCRKTVTVDSCNVCGDASVLFYVKGSCEFVEAASEDVEELILDNEPGQQEIPVPELEAVFQDDGTYVYEEVKSEKEEIDDVEPQDYIPELEAVVQEDGTTVYELAPERVETTQEQVEIIPELAAVLQEDGTYVYEEVKYEKEEIDDVEKQDFIPELEAVVQVDGSVVYEEVKNSQEQEEAVEVDCAYQTQEEIPELPVPEDGVVICVEVVTPTEEVFPVAQNEEASVVLSNNEESQTDEPQQIEAIQTRLLVEPDN